MMAPRGIGLRPKPGLDPRKAARKPAHRPAPRPAAHDRRRARSRLNQPMHGPARSVRRRHRAKACGGRGLALSSPTKERSAMPRDAQTATTWKDYTPPAYPDRPGQLVFRLDPARNPRDLAHCVPAQPAGHRARLFPAWRSLTLIRARIDGAEITPRLVRGRAWEANGAPDAPFTWERRVEIAPRAIPRWKGLYMSNGMFCTQCRGRGLPQDHLFTPTAPDVWRIPRPHRKRPAGAAVNGNPAARVRAGPNARSLAETGLSVQPWIAGICSGGCRSVSPPVRRVVDLNIWVRPVATRPIATSAWRR